MTVLDEVKKDKNGKSAKLKTNEYLRELSRLHVELVKLQQWVVHKGQKICVVFEGRDGAGKGGVIKAMVERVSPRVFRVVALPAPTEREKSQMYLQRYIRHLPAAGEIVIFDRSWYNRAGVERAAVTPIDGRRIVAVVFEAGCARIGEGGNHLIRKLQSFGGAEVGAARGNRRIADGHVD